MSVMHYCLLKAAGKENIRMQNLRKPGGWFMKKVLAAGSGFKLEQRVAIAEAYRLQSVTVQELLKARPQGSKEVDYDTIGKAFSELYESEVDSANSWTPDLLFTSLLQARSPSSRETAPILKHLTYYLRHFCEPGRPGRERQRQLLDT